GTGAARPAPPARGEALLQGRLILVVEDNEINRQVITRQLALLGYAADLAGDGLEAIERLRGADYALVLTDLHMPAMDGYELAIAERGRERVHGGRRVPIVALTANALKGEAQRCQAAGMDDYLSKPVALDELKAMLDKWLAPQAAAPAVPPAPTFDALPVFQADALAALVGADAAIIDELHADFLRNAADIVAEIAAARDDWPRVGALAHKLKSSARAVGAFALGERCAQLEAAVKAGDAAAAEPLRVALGEAHAAVSQAIDAHRTGG
ncbi:MAG: response regulator, partial [Sulfuritalea sp.]|nr:response regulator [Sulfuritalea sp.]